MERRSRPDTGSRIGITTGSPFGDRLGPLETRSVESNVGRPLKGRSLFGDDRRRVATFERALPPQQLLRSSQETRKPENEVPSTKGSTVSRGGGRRTPSPAPTLSWVLIGFESIA